MKSRIILIEGNTNRLIRLSKSSIFTVTALEDNWNDMVNLKAKTNLLPAIVFKKSDWTYVKRETGLKSDYATVCIDDCKMKICRIEVKNINHGKDI